jgi:hypothetical protein
MTSKPHPDFDGHPERPFEAWSAEEKLRFAATLRSMQERTVILPPREAPSKRRDREKWD